MGHMREKSRNKLINKETVFTNIVRRHHELEILKSVFGATITCEQYANDIMQVDRAEQFV